MTVQIAAFVFLVLPFLVAGYAYAGYPALLWLVGLARSPRPLPESDPPHWPSVSISLPAYNEEQTIAAALDSLLALDYPEDRLQVVVTSDASTDRTDEIVRGYADRGVQLLRLPERAGKTGAENFAASHLRGELIVNTDATTRIPPSSLKRLVRVFQDPELGCASGRDVSVGAAERDSTIGERGYVSYEMWVRSLETRLGSIVGASGCFYAIRADLHRRPFPEFLSRDFAAALLTREEGLRAVSVDDAICFVPRAASLATEYARKLRTMARGLETLWHKKHLLNPFRYGAFSWMLFSHKLSRWIVPLTVPLAIVGLGILAARSMLAAIGLGFVLLATLAGWVTLRLFGARRLPWPFAALAYAVGAVLAGLVAWLNAFRGSRYPKWEPTRR